MISPETIRRYRVFAGLTHEQVVILADLAEEFEAEAGSYFFREASLLEKAYLCTEGEIGIVIELPTESASQTVAGQLTGSIPTRDVVVSTVGPGDVFGWSGLVDPYTATATAKALKTSCVIAFDCARLRQAFETDCGFGYVMVQKAVQVYRNRLRDLRIESLALLAS